MDSSVGATSLRSCTEGFEVEKVQAQGSVQRRLL